MKCTLVGSRYFGAAVLQNLLEDGIEVVRVVAPAADDRLAVAAMAANIPLSILASPRQVPGTDLHEDTDIIVAAHTHAFISKEALARARIGAFGYHPSLLPRHRGIAAVEWTLLEGDPIAGGSIYHLDDGWDAGAIAAQDWCFVVKGENARELWERALSPMGLKLIRQVVDHARTHGTLPSMKQDERFATRAPLIKRNVTLTAQTNPLTTSLVVTIVGRDRPGLVRQLSDCTHGFSVNWADSRMTHFAGQFAGMVHLQVSPEHAEPLIEALHKLETAGLQVKIARNDAHTMAADRRMLKLELTGPDRPGIVRQLSASLAERHVSIEDLHTELVSTEQAAQHTFKIKALLVVPQALSDESLRQTLEKLASELLLDIALDEHAA